MIQSGTIQFNVNMTGQQNEALSGSFSQSVSFQKPFSNTPVLLAMPKGIPNNGNINAYVTIGTNVSAGTISGMDIGISGLSPSGCTLTVGLLSEKVKFPIAAIPIATFSIQDMPTIYINWLAYDEVTIGG